MTTTMECLIRQEQEGDYCQTEHVMREAFWNYYSPGCCEHYILHVMRDCPAFVPTLDIVIESNGKIIGNIVYLKALIKADDGEEYEVLSLGPIAVLPEYQSKGVGRRMIEYTKELARNMGFRAIFLCGDPDYYSQLGFVSAEELDIRTADNMYAVALQVCELYDNALAGITGKYIEDTIYEVDPVAVATFDKGFPVKEKISGTPSQKRFDQIVVMRRSVE